MAKARIIGYTQTPCAECIFAKGFIGQDNEKVKCNNLARAKQIDQFDFKKPHVVSLECNGHFTIFRTEETGAGIQCPFWNNER